MSSARALAERVGGGHEHAVLLEARRRTIAVVREMAARVIPGMPEEDGLELARLTLRAHGFERDDQVGLRGRPVCSRQGQGDRRLAVDGLYTQL